MAIKSSEDQKSQAKSSEASEEKKQIKGVDDEVLHMTKSELFEVVQKLSKEKDYSKTKTDALLEDMLDAIRQGNEGTRTISLRQYSEEEINVDDYLEEPVMVYCYRFLHICIGDTRWGQPVKTPYNRPIRFKPLYRYQKPGVSRYDTEIVSMSCAILRSKKERDFIRNHTHFGICYFESPKETHNIERQLADKLVEMSNMLNSMSQFEVIERARMEGMKITNDVDDIKKRLTYLLAEQSMKNPKLASMPSDPNWTPEKSGEVLMNEKELEKVPMT